MATYGETLAQLGLQLGPFLLIWGALLVPTLIFWTSLVTLLFALTRNRYTTYALGLAVLAGTGLLQTFDKMNWAGNWDLWSVLRWTDLGPFQMDRTALILNRLAALGMAAFFLVLALRVFPRRDPDAVRTIHRLEPAGLLRGFLRLSPYWMIPATLIVVLAVMVGQGFQGRAARNKDRDYWKQNLATWKDAPLPALRRVDVDLTLDPARSSFRTIGSYRFVNRLDHPVRQIPLTGGAHWRDVSFSINGDSTKPENRTGLYVLTPKSPLQPGESLQVGFAFHGKLPGGISRNGGGIDQFILPAGVVLTSFSPSFLPLTGYEEERGMEKENRYEPRVYPDDYFRQTVPPAFGSGAPFRSRIRIHIPEDYTANSVGVLVADSVSGGMRTSLWESDAGVRFLNVVAGRWKSVKGEGTAVFYFPRHTYNIAEMNQTLEAARKYYSDWFYPYPWRELKISEFPSLAGYAQGFPTNIPFSEGIGFLTKDSAKESAAFVVTAHESAHQWWGNILTPGKGPGGDILSEGMAHFSTILLLDSVKGPQARIEFCKRIEAKYGRERSVDSERPLVKIDGSRTGDETVTYDKGGWVFWMLLNRMGRDGMLAGLRRFIGLYKDGPDYPLLEDLVQTLRPFAADSTDYDAFTRQWFLQLVIPEYRLSDVKLVPAAGGSERAGNVGPWIATARLRNLGTGTMPVEVAAISGERFGTDGKPNSGYSEARTSVILSAGEESAISIPCSFKPARLVVDPDARVLQLRREAATAGF